MVHNINPRHLLLFSSLNMIFVCHLSLLLHPNDLCIDELNSVCWLFNFLCGSSTVFLKTTPFHYIIESSVELPVVSIMYQYTAE